MLSLPFMRYTSEMDTSESLNRRHRFPLSFRDVEEILATGGVTESYPSKLEHKEVRLRRTVI
jgi:hypothetical protein